MKKVMIYFFALFLFLIFSDCRENDTIISSKTINKIDSLSRNLSENITRSIYISKINGQS